MAYRVRLNRSAQRDLDSIEARTNARIVRRITGFAENPRPPGVKKLHAHHPSWRLRVGAFRILYEVDDEVGEVIVYQIVQRKDEYRR